MKARCCIVDVLSAFVAVVVAVAPQHALAQEAPTPRRVAPDRVPAYGGASEQAPPVTVVPATEGLPYGACDKDLPPRLRILCLRQTSELMDGLASEAVKEVVIAIGERPGISQGQRHFVEHTLSQVQELWLKVRDLECGSLARFDISLDGDAYEQRLRCLIRADRERITLLKHRYGKDTRRP